MGGLNVLVSFQSKVIMESLLKDNRDWLLSWFSSIDKWPGQIVPPSRCVWLRCFGVALNVWSTENFFAVGSLWGDVISLDENTLKSLSFEKFCCL